MKVLHLSHTPLVGAAWQVCRALLRPENCQGLPFNMDWRWDTDEEEALNFLDQADVIHLHNYIDLDCQDFELNQNTGCGKYLSE